MHTLLQKIRKKQHPPAYLWNGDLNKCQRSRPHVELLTVE